jgi:outer membrane protein assembly factor BamB
VTDVRGRTMQRAVALRTPLKTVGLMVAFAGALGCANSWTPSDRVNPETPLWYHHLSGALRVTFSREVTVPGRTTGEDYERGTAAIDPISGRVFIGSADRGLYALRAHDGSSIWRFETLGVVQSEPYYDRELDYVYFGSHDGGFYCVRAADGGLVWRFMTGAEVARKPIRSGEILYVANAADQLFALDRRTGKQRWWVHRTPALGMEVAGYAGPALDRDKVFFAYSDGHVGAYDANDGTERWPPVDLSAEAEQQNPGGEAPRYLDVDTTPIPDTIPQGRVIYVASYAAGVYALDADSGTRVWSNDKAIGATDLTLWDEPAHVPNAFGPDRGGPIEPERKLLLATSATSGLWALDPATGRSVWRIQIPEGGMTPPVPVAGALLVGTTRYGLFLLSPRNGRVIDAIDLGSGFAGTPAAFGQRAFVMSNQGTILGLSIDVPFDRPQKGT